MDNEKRALRVEKALEGYDEGGEVGIIDLLADIRHYCDLHGIDFAEFDRMAYLHYEEERGSNYPNCIPIGESRVMELEDKELKLDKAMDLLSDLASRWDKDDDFDAPELGERLRNFVTGSGAPKGVSG